MKNNPVQKPVRDLVGDFVCFLRGLAIPSRSASSGRALRSPMLAVKPENLRRVSPLAMGKPLVILPGGFLKSSIGEDRHRTVKAKESTSGK